MVTIKDIAKLAGVAQGTVSNVTDFGVFVKVEGDLYLAFYT